MCFYANQPFWVVNPNRSCTRSSGVAMSKDDDRQKRTIALNHRLLNVLDSVRLANQHTENMHIEIRGRWWSLKSRARVRVGVESCHNYFAGECLVHAVHHHHRRGRPHHVLEIRVRINRRTTGRFTSAHGPTKCLYWFTNMVGTRPRPALGKFPI